MGRTMEMLALATLLLGMGCREVEIEPAPPNTKPPCVPEVETCNGVDDDCDDLMDDEDPDAERAEWVVDADGDGVGGTSVVAVCAPSGAVDAGGDCDDGDPEVYPGAVERCDDARDLDCDGDPELGDADGDGIGACSDCDDSDREIYPGAVEDCTDPRDLDCDGDTEFEDADGDGAPACAECDDRNPALTSVMFTDETGVVRDVWTTFAATTDGRATAVSWSEDGILSFCPGEYDLALIVIASRLTLRGTGSAPEDTTLVRNGADYSDWGPVVTIESGVEELVVENLTLGDGEPCVYQGSGPMATVRLDRAVVQDCYSVYDEDAAGLHLPYANLTAQDSVLSQNVIYLGGTSDGASARGGAARVGGDVTLVGCNVSGNQIKGYGQWSGYAAGGALLVKGDLVAEETTFVGNRASAAASYYSYYDSATGTAMGGAAYVEGSVTLIDTWVDGSSASASGGSSSASKGGGIYVKEAFSCIATSEGLGGFVQNSAAHGALYWEGDEGDTLTSDLCDWGDGGTDNSGGDIRGNVEADYGDAASFTCTVDGCVEATP